jgi:hypothetical protein
MGLGYITPLQVKSMTSWPNAAAWKFARKKPFLLLIFSITPGHLLWLASVNDIF